MPRLLLLLFVLLLSGTTLGQTYQILPATPVADEGMVIAAQWPYSGNFVQTRTVKIVGRAINVRYVQDGGNFEPNPQIITSSVVVPPPLRPGTYTVTIDWVPSGGPPVPTQVLTVEVALGPAGPAPARLERIAGDRQIVTDNVSFKPFSVKVVDASGSPLPRVGVLIGRLTRIQPGPFMEDAFGFRGFNVDPYEVDYFAFGFPPPDASYGVSDAQGIVTVPATPANSAPSGYVAGATVLSGAARSAIQTFFSIVRVGSRPPGNPSVIVEYYDSELDHYFNTLLDTEIKLLDAGAFAGWTRSTGAFIGYPTLADAPPGAVPVCRFFSSVYTSHFYSADAAECDAVARQWPDVWTLETKEAFYIMPADHSTGACPGGYQSVFRLYNNRAAPNHRYITDRTLKDAMIAAGWIAEGYGPTATIMCTPA